MGFTSVDVSPSPKSHKYLVAPDDWLVKNVLVFSMGGFGVQVNAAVGIGYTVIVKYSDVSTLLQVVVSVAIKRIS
jgi:hypothetical protein